MLEGARGLLEGLQNEDGGWPATSGRPSRTESTALALLALSNPAQRSARVDRAVDWLLAHQRSDGWWPAGVGMPEPSWMSSLAALALAGEPDGAGAAKRGGAWILEQRGRSHSWIMKLLLRFFARDGLLELDPNLTGWPWTPGAFGWIEPTSYALLALRRLRSELPEDRVDDRLRDGERMILDRECVGGGWNYGNSRVLGEELWPYPDTTAWALLALQGSEEHETVEAGLNALAGMLGPHASGLALALSILCYRAFGRPTAGLGERLEARIADSGLLGEARGLALTVMALDPGRVALRVGAR